MNDVIEQYTRAFSWIQDPPAAGKPDPALVARCGRSLEQIEQDFEPLLEEVRQLGRRSRESMRAGVHIDSYVDGRLKDGVNGPLVAVASSAAEFAALDDVMLSDACAAFWRSGALEHLITEAASKPLADGHRLGCVTATFDADQGELELHVRFVRGGEVSLACGTIQSLPSTSDLAWMQDLAAASNLAAQAAAEVDPPSASPARPGEAGGEVGEIAQLVAAAIAAGEESLALDLDIVEASLTRVELAEALGSPVSAIEIGSTAEGGALLVWGPGATSPTTLLLGR